MGLNWKFLTLVDIIIRQKKKHLVFCLVALERYIYNFCKACPVGSQRQINKKLHKFQASGNDVSTYHRMTFG